MEVGKAERENGGGGGCRRAMAWRDKPGSRVVSLRSSSRSSDIKRYQAILAKKPPGATTITIAYSVSHDALFFPPVTFLSIFIAAHARPRMQHIISTSHGLPLHPIDR